MTKPTVSDWTAELMKMPPTGKQTRAEPKFARLPIDDIVPGPNVRVDLRDIEELAADIRARGILQPLTVVPSVDGKQVELLIGHRRLAAAKLAGLEVAPCMMRPRDHETARLCDQLAENLQRSDMTALEQAKAFKALHDQGLTFDQIGARVHRSDYWVKRIMGILDLPEFVQRAVHEGLITTTRAVDIDREMLKAPGAMKRLESFIKNQGGKGLQYWYQGEYARREAQEYAADGRKAAASAGTTCRSDEEAIRRGREQTAKQRAYNGAAHELINLHQAEFARLYDAQFLYQMELLER